MLLRQIPTGTSLYWSPRRLFKLVDLDADSTIAAEEFNMALAPHRNNVAFSIRSKESVGCSSMFNNFGQFFGLRFANALAASAASPDYVKI